MRLARSILIIMCFCIFVFNCSEDANDIIGSRDHEIKIENTGIPEILANGTSALTITAKVFNNEGVPTSGMKVIFETTHGAIEEFTYSDSYGEASVLFTSIASQDDILAEVKATVLDTAFQNLSKKNSGSVHVSLEIPGYNFASQTASLRKGNNTQEYDASLKIRLLGVTLTSSVQDSILPADGMSETKVTVKLRETTSQKPIKNEKIFFNALKGTIGADQYTNENGIAEANLKSADEAGLDSLRIIYGVGLTANLMISYVEPKLDVSSAYSQIIADGASNTQIVATLLTVKNTPIVGAEINFSTTAGIIQSIGVTDDYGKATVSLVSAKEPHSQVVVTGEFLTLKDTTTVAFVANLAEQISFVNDADPILRDGQAIKHMSLKVIDNFGNAKSNTTVTLNTDFGFVPPTVTTDEQGVAQFEFISDSGSEDVTATIAARLGSYTATQRMTLVGITLTLSASPDSIPANGAAESVVRLELKQTTTNIPITNYQIAFGSTFGTISQSAVTNDQGVAAVAFTAGHTSGVADISVYYGTSEKTIPVFLFENYPTSILLESHNNFIWVKETGQIEQTDITATVLGVTGEPIGDNFRIQFNITNGPGGGERLEPSSGVDNESQIINTNNGVAAATLIAGTRSGQVQIQAQLVEYPNVTVKSSKIVIRSGPPYMWVDPGDPNHVVQHGTVLVDPGKHNTAFANPLQEIEVTAVFADKYNNPVEKNTAVYFTTTGGVISSDALTCDLGKASVILQNSNPFPVLQSPDVSQLTGHRFPNPNDVSRMIDLGIPDFEGNVISNTAGNSGENDGVAGILAKTAGQDQNGNDITVWASTLVVFSSGIHTFTATTNKTELNIGESAHITIRLYDVNGNPVAAGSSLNVSSESGELSETELMPEPERYGFGSTIFSTQLSNNLDPENDKAKTTNVLIELKSPNGDGKISIPIKLNITSGS